jgi:SMI1 / KNR4 family (SUKH-1)
MSELTEALESIRDWLEKNNPYEFSHLRAGLSRDEIDELVKDLPFTVPEEIYELYQWHDGRVDRFIRNSYNFMSLKEAISVYQEEVSENSYNSREEAYLFEQSFPVFQLWYQGDVLYTIIASGQNKGKVILYDPECRSYSLQYSNLTNLVKHGAEWCELAYYLNDEESWEVRDGRQEAELDIKYILRENMPIV